MQELKKLAIEHDYYCSECNYYSNRPAQKYGNMTEFMDEYEDTDIDMNLCFRWDIREKRDSETDEPTGSYCAEVFIMQQRKGIFKPIMIENVNEEEAIRFKKYAKKHWEKLKQIWKPISKGKKK